jgi:hypothetical protein
MDRLRTLHEASVATAAESNDGKAKDGEVDDEADDD